MTARDLSAAALAGVLLSTAPAAAPALAESPGSSGSIQLRGEVPVVCTVAVADRGVTLDLSRSFDKVTVASVEERCNAAGGYSVTVASQNGTQLRPATGGGGVPYSISYDGAASSGGGALTASRPAAPAPQSRELGVSGAPPAGLQAGSYADVITVTISGR